MENEFSDENRRGCNHESLVKNQSWIKGWLAAVSLIIVLGVPSVVSHAGETNRSVGKMKDDISEIKADMKSFIAASRETNKNYRREMDEIKTEIQRIKEKKE